MINQIPCNFKVLPLELSQALTDAEFLCALNAKINELVTTVNGLSGQGNDSFVSISRYPKKWHETDDTPRFLRALNAAVRLNTFLFLPIGEYFIKGDIPTDNAIIIGQQRPTYNGVELQDGTIVKGYFNCNGHKYVSISNLGIDNRGMYNTSGDGIENGLIPTAVNIFHNYTDLTLVGGWKTTENQHGILCQGGNYVNMENIEIHNFLHGVALRNGEATVRNISCFNCTSSTLIVKANNENPLVENVNISNVKGRLSEWESVISSVNGIYIQSLDSGIVRNVNIDNVVIDTAQSSVVTDKQGTGSISNINVSNCVSRNSGYSGTVYGSIGADNMTFTNCKAYTGQGYAFRNSENNNSNAVIGCATNYDQTLWSLGYFKTCIINGWNLFGDTVVEMQSSTTVRDWLLTARQRYNRAINLTQTPVRVMYSNFIGSVNNGGMTIFCKYTGTAGGEEFYSEDILQMMFSGTNDIHFKAVNVRKLWSGGSFDTTLNYRLTYDSATKFLILTVASTAYTIYGTLDVEILADNVSVGQWNMSPAYFA